MEKGGRVATAARVRVAPGGRLQVLRLVTAFDCGAVVSPDNLGKVIQQINKRVQKGTSNLNSSNSQRVTRRSL